MLWFNGAIYADTSAPQWYKWSGTTWNTVSADPRVTTTVVGNLGTTTPNSSLVDASNNVWAADSSGVCYENGTSKCTSAISKMLYMNASIYSQLSTGGWQKWTGSAWSSIAKDPRYSFQLGMNFSGLECGSAGDGNPYGHNVDLVTASPFYTYWNGQKMYSVRLPFLWERIQPTLAGSLDSTYLGQIESAVNSAAAEGQTVLLDMHNYAAYAPTTSSHTCSLASGSGNPTSCVSYGSCGCYAPGGTALTTSDFADVWKRIATVFGATVNGVRTYPNIYGYDIMNEPARGTAAQWTPFAQAAINAIRQVDTVTPIFVEGEGYSTVNGFANANPSGTLDTLTDSSNLIVFSGHNYANQGSQSYTTYAGSSDTAQSMVNNYTGSSSQFANWCKTQVTNGVAIGCHIGEGGVSTGSDNGGTDGQNLLTMMDNAITAYKNDNFPFHYWQGGPCEGAAGPGSTTAWSGSGSNLTQSPQWSGEGSVSGMKTYVPGP